MAESSGVAATTEHDACPHCGGNGWQIVDDGGNGAARSCPCREATRVRDLLARAAIPPRHRHCRLDNFNTGNRTATERIRRRLLEAKRKSERFIEQFVDLDSQRFRSSGLLFIGPPGTGKTHLASAVLTALIERYRVRGRFVNFSHLVYEIQATFDPSTVDTRRKVLDPIIHAEVLVLDELGATKPSDWVQDQLYDLINKRYCDELPTIFTTNYQIGDDAGRLPAPKLDGPPPMTDAAVAGEMPLRGRGMVADSASAPTNLFAQLDTRIRPMLTSRLYEMTQPILLGSWDYRQQVILPRRRSGA